MVKKNDPTRGSAPGYDAIRNYVFSGSARGELRVKYGNHAKELELGTKGLFAKGERHELTLNVLTQVVEKRYGKSAANQFRADLSNEKKTSDSGKFQSTYTLDKGSVREALTAIEQKFSNKSAVPKYPQILNVTQDTDDARVKALAFTWNAARTATEDPLFPREVAADMHRNRFALSDQGGVLQSGHAGRNGLNEHDYLAQEKETMLQCFEKNVGISRNDPDFQNMFRNFVRNFHQNAEGVLMEKLYWHANSVGYDVTKFMLDAYDVNATTRITFSDTEVIVNREVVLPAELADENIKLKGTLIEDFRIPIEALKTPEAEFDIAKVLVNPTSHYSLVQVN